MTRALAHGEPVTRLRWSTWVLGEGQGAPDELQLDGVSLHPSYPDAAAAVGRPGLVVPRHDLYTRDTLVDLAVADLIVTADGTTVEVTGPVARHRSPLSGRAHIAVAPCTEHVDTGPETIIVFGSEVVVDSYGDDHTRRTSTVGVECDRVTVEPVPVPETAGDATAAPVWRVSGRTLGVLDAWSVVEWPAGSGRMHDVTGSPTRHPWPRARAHASALIRERS